jgi:hypothetical protein
LKKIQDDLKALRGDIGSMAASIVSIKREIHVLQREISGLKETIVVLAVAVDGHTIRLDHIEQRLGIGTPANRDSRSQTLPWLLLRDLILSRPGLVLPAGL